METSEKLDKIGADLTLAQAEMGGAVKDSENPFFKSKYSSLTSVWKACKDALHKYGFSVIQSPIDIDGRIGVETMLLHKSGQFIRDRFTLGVKKINDPQADGSSISYARRYALAAFVGICPEDDDAEKGMNRNVPLQSETISATKKPTASQLTPKQQLFTKCKTAKLTNPESKDFVDWYVLQIQEGESTTLTDTGTREMVKNFDDLLANWREYVNAEKGMVA